MSGLLQVEELRKEYPGVVAVNGLSFTLEEGQVLAILGENGAGKSTTMKMISGVEKPDQGVILLNGKAMHFHNSHDAAKEGIGIVFQELSLVDTLSVAENIFMNRQPVKASGMINFELMYEKTKELLSIFRLDIDPKMLVGKLSTGKKQIIEILKAISQKPKILILDEPTSSLSDVEIEEMYQVVDRLKAEGMSFIYVSHKLNEIFRLCDHVVIMRDGQFVMHDSIENMTEDTIVTNMVGREIKDLYGERALEETIGGKVLEVKNLSKTGYYRNISFDVHRGEIVGIYGLVGAGRTEMAEGLIAFDYRDEGEVYINDRKLRISHPADAIHEGIGYVTENRKELGLYLDKSIRDNLVVNDLAKFARRGMLRDQNMDVFVDEAITKHGVACYGSAQDVGKLSGGNQQKVLLAMWLELEPIVMIFDEPTRGVDIGAKSEIYNQIRQYTSAGNASVIISSEIPELIGICDRILVMKEGIMVGEFNRSEFSEESIVGCASGVHRA